MGDARDNEDLATLQLLFPHVKNEIIASHLCRYVAPNRILIISNLLIDVPTSGSSTCVNNSLTSPICSSLKTSQQCSSSRSPQLCSPSDQIISPPSSPLSSTDQLISPPSSPLIDVDHVGEEDSQTMFIPAKTTASISSSTAAISVAPPVPRSISIAPTVSSSSASISVSRTTASVSVVTTLPRSITSIAPTVSSSSVHLSRRAITSKTSTSSVIRLHPQVSLTRLPNNSTILVSSGSSESDYSNDYSDSEMSSSSENSDNSLFSSECSSSEDAASPDSICGSEIDAAEAEVLIEEEEEEEEEQLIVPLPKCWKEPKTTKQVVDVLRNSPEWLKLRAQFLKGMTITKVRVSRIQRVQNSYLYKAYIMQKKLMEEKIGKGQLHERTLFHGTSTTPPSLIWKSDHGFDLRHCKQGAWGIGAYFAERSQYSQAYAYRHGRELQMFVAKVLTGHTIEQPPDRSLRMPPMRTIDDSGGAVLFDSVSGLTDISRIFVLYELNKAYPQYLISYTLS